MVRVDHSSSAARRRSAIGTERRVERSDLPSVECSPRTQVLRTRMRWTDQSTSRQRSPSSSDWRRPVMAAVRMTTRSTGPRTPGGGGGAGPDRPRRVGAGWRRTMSLGGKLAPGLGVAAKRACGRLERRAGQTAEPGRRRRWAYRAGVPAMAYWPWSMAPSASGLALEAGQAREKQDRRARWGLTRLSDTCPG